MQLDDEYRQELAAAFLSRWPPTAASSPEGALAQALVDAAAAAATTWPVIQIPLDVFMAYLAERADPSGSPLQALAGLRVTDLYLACACALGDRRAVALFDAVYLTKLRPTLGRINPSPAFADEVIQELRVGLLLPDESSDREAKIAQYRGRGSLKGWLEVSAKRLALAHARQTAVDPPVDAFEDLVDAAAAANPELDQLRLRYTDDFREVVRQGVSQVLQQLSLEERNLLRWHLLEGVSLRKLAAIRGANVSTVSRDFARVRARILDQVRGQLAERAGLPAPDIDSIMGALLSRISISLNGILKDAP